MLVHRKRNRKYWKLILVPFLLIFFYLTWYQLAYRSTQVEGNIFVLKKILQGHSSDIWTIKFSPAGSMLASGSVDSTVKLWDSRDQHLITTIRQPEGITSLDFSPGGDYLATASYDGKLRLWKVPEGILQKEFSGHKGTVWSISFSPDGKTIAGGGEDATIKLWDVETGRLINTLPGHSRNIWDIKFSPDGKYLASGSFDKTIKIWSMPDGRLLRTLTDHSEAVVALAFSHDGTKLAGTSDDKTTIVWNTADWSSMLVLTTPEHQQAADFSPDDKMLLTGGRDKPAIGEFLQNIFGDSKFNKGVSMRLWDVRTGKLLQTFSTHANDVNDVSFSPDGHWIASGSSDRSIGIWAKD